MPLTVEQIGRLEAYAIQGVPFEKYASNQKITPEDLAQAERLYDDVIETQRRAAAAGGYVSPIND